MYLRALLFTLQTLDIDMKTVLTIVVCVVFFLVLGDTTIQFKPFRINIEHWYRPVAIILMMLALIIYTVGEHTKGYKEGLNQGVEQVFNELKKQKEQNGN